MTAISVSERLLEMAAFYTPLALTVTLNLLSGKPGRISKGGLAGHVTIRYNIEHLHENSKARSPNRMRDRALLFF